MVKGMIPGASGSVVNVEKLKKEMKLSVFPCQRQQSEESDGCCLEDFTKDT